MIQPSQFDDKEKGNLTFHNTFNIFLSDSSKLKEDARIAIDTQVRFSLKSNI